MRKHEWIAYCVVALFLLLPGCSDGHDGPPTQTTVVVGVQGAVLRLGAFALTVPAGALAQAQTLVLSRSTAAAPHGYAAVSPLYRLQPEGRTFLSPLTLVFEGAPAEAVMVWARDGKTFEPLASTLDGGRLTATVSYSGRGFVAIPSCRQGAACSVSGARCGWYSEVCAESADVERRNDCSCNGGEWSCALREEACEAPVPDAAVPDAGLDSGLAPLDASLADSSARELGDASASVPDAGWTDAGLSGGSTCQRVFGTGGGSEWAGDVASDGQGNAYVVQLLLSGTVYDSVVRKVDAQCNVLWMRSIAAPTATGAEIISVATDAAGAVLLYGQFSGSVGFGGSVFSAAPADKHLFVAKLSSSGEHVWSRDFGGAGTVATGRALALDLNGSAIISGLLWSGGVDFGGGTIAGPASIGNSYDSFVTKLDSAGNHVFSTRWRANCAGASSCGLDPLDVATSVDGKIGIAAQLQGTIDISGGTYGSKLGESSAMLMKLEAGGSYSFVGAYGNGAYARRLRFTSSSGAVVSGSLFPSGTLNLPGGLIASGDGNTNGWIAGFDAQMVATWVQTIARSEAMALSLDATGQALVTGSFIGIGVPRDGGLSVARGLFVNRYASNGMVTSMRMIPFDGDDPVPITARSAVDPSGAWFLSSTLAGTVDFGLGALTGTGMGDSIVVRYAP